MVNEENILMKKYNKTTYNAYVIPVVEPIQDLYTAANNNIYISHLLIYKNQ